MNPVSQLISRMIRSLPGQLRSSWAAFAHDLLMIPVAWMSAYWMRFNLGRIPDEYITSGLYALLLIVPVQIIAFYRFGLYRGVWRFASMPDIMRILKATVIGTVVALVLLFVFTRLQGVPRSIPLMYPLILVMLLAGPRFIYRWFKDYRLQPGHGTRVLIVGAGSAGEMLVRDLIKEREKQYNPVGFVDDNPRRKGHEIHGVRVLGSTRQLPALVQEHAADIIILAIPNATAAQMRRIVRHCSRAGVPFRTLPRLQDFVSGRSTLQELREVSIDDLLGREPVVLDTVGISHGIQGKVILVSGAGGSIGSELCRQISKYSPELLILVDHSEYNLYRIYEELLKAYPRQRIIRRLIDVTDRVAVEYLLRTNRPSTIFHAAAYKHVPMLEDQARPALKNNVLGTRILAEAADKYQVEEFVLVSTDKAVNPTNVMGATKRVSELICQNINERSKTRYVTVRFGNVLDSAGSVVPLFREQIRAGGPVTVTDPEITRFFMTIPEASQLIMQAAVLGKGGEIFVLDMGKPVRIADLARQMIMLSGKVPDKDIAIVYTSLRPGEKMHEELFHEKEQEKQTAHPKIKLANSRLVDWDWLQELLGRIERAVAQHDEQALQAVLSSLVPEFNRQSSETNVIPFAPQPELK